MHLAKSSECSQNNLNSVLKRAEREVASHTAAAPTPETVLEQSMYARRKSGYCSVSSHENSWISILGGVFAYEYRCKIKFTSGLLIRRVRQENECRIVLRVMSNVTSKLSKRGENCGKIYFGHKVAFVRIVRPIKQ